MKRVAGGGPFSRTTGPFGLQMPYHVCVLANPDDRIYIGQTQNLDRCLREYNDPDDRTTLHTKRFPGPWRAAASSPLRLAW